MDAIQHLLAARAAMQADRDAKAAELAEDDRQLGYVDELIERMRRDAGHASVSSAASGAPPLERAVVRTVREVVLSVAERGTPFSLGHVVSAAEAEGLDAKYASISSILSRMVKEGVLKRGKGRGWFELITEDDAPIPQLDQNAEDPAGSGVLEHSSFTSTEGGDGDDDHPSDHHHPAIVGGS